MPKLDPDDPRPNYVQVAADIRETIEDGQLSAGARLPSHGETATEYGVSISTVKRAYAALESDGLIVRRQGLGAFVRTRPAKTVDTDDSEALATIHATLSDLTVRLAAVERRLTDTGR